MTAQFTEFETINDQDLQAAAGGIVAVPEKLGHPDIDHIKKMGKALAKKMHDGASDVA